jgi:carbonic anhydrase/acetyltransferase-like protein (isoleucine patch superfamily)
VVGPGATIGHHAIVHGCTIGDNSLIGMGATLLNGVKIGANSLVGAGALVTEGKEFPDGSLIVGAPAKAVRALDEAAIAGLRKSALKVEAPVCSKATVSRCIKRRGSRRDRMIRLPPAPELFHALDRT